MDSKTQQYYLICFLLYSSYFFSTNLPHLYYVKIPGNKAQFLWTQCLNSFIIFKSIRGNKVQEWLVMQFLIPQILFWKPIKVMSHSRVHLNVLAGSQVSLNLNPRGLTLTSVRVLRLHCYQARLLAQIHQHACRATSSQEVLFSSRSACVHKRYTIWKTSPSTSL